MGNELHKPTLRVLDIIELVSKTQSGYKLSEIAKQIGVPVSTLYPIVHTMKDKKYLSYDEKSQVYSMGLRVFEMGTNFVNSSNSFEGVRKALHEIVMQCRETCHFGILDEGDVLYLAKVDSEETIRMHSSIGKRMPAYGTAIGKALLCDYSLEQLTQLYPDGCRKLTKNTITDLNILYNQLVTIRQTGYAYENEESNEMITCIASPIYKNEKVAAALSVAIPIFRFSEEKKVLVEKLLAENVRYLETLMPFLNI